MSFAKRLRVRSSPRSFRFAWVAAGGAVIATAAALHDIYRLLSMEDTQSYNHGFPSAQSQQDMTRLVHTVAMSMGMDSSHIDKLSVIPSPANSAFSLGSLRLGNICYVGVPYSFYSSKQDMATNIRIGESVLDAVSASNVAESMKPTMPEMEFSIAHELAHLQGEDTLIALATVPVSAALTMLPIAKIPQRWWLIAKVFGVIGIIGGNLALRSAMYHMQEMRADMRAASTSPRILQGGIDACRRRAHVDRVFEEIAARANPNSESAQQVAKLAQSFAHPSTETRIARLERLRDAQCSAS